MKNRKVLMYSVVTLALLSITYIPTDRLKLQLMVLGLSFLFILIAIILVVYDEFFSKKDENLKTSGTIVGIISLLGIIHWIISSPNLYGTLLPFSLFTIGVGILFWNLWRIIKWLYKKYRKYP